MSEDNNEELVFALVLIVGVIGYAAYQTVTNEPVQQLVNNIIPSILFLIGACGLFFTLYCLDKKSKEQKTVLADTKFIITTLIISLLLISTPFLNINFYRFKNVNFVKILTYALTLIIISIIIWKIIQHKKARKAFKENYGKMLDRIKSKKYDDLGGLESALKEIKNLKGYKIAKEFQEKIKDAEEKIESDSAQLKYKIEMKNELEQQEKRRIRQQEAKEQETIQKLIQYFENKKSIETIPYWAKNTNPKLIEKAKDQYIDEERAKTREEEKQKEQEQRWQKAARFILQNKELPSTFHELNNQEQELYLKALQLLDQGKLEEEITEEIPEEPQDPYLRDEEKEFLNQNFHEAKYLNAEQKEKLLRYGYKYYSTTDLTTGKLGNKVLIRNKQKNESNHHFSQKHLLKTLDPHNAELEHHYDNQWADLVFTYSECKIAVEIETGTNKETQINKKVEWLNKNFEYWIIVCPRKHLTYYKKFIDKKQSFCLTITEVAEKLDELKLALTMI